MFYALRDIFDFCGTIFIWAVDLIVVFGFATLAILPVSRVMPAKIREGRDSRAALVMILVYVALLLLGGTICENFWRGFAEICGDYSWCKVLLYWRDARRGFSGG